MIQCKPGDHVLCRIKDDKFITAYEPYDQEVKFLVLAPRHKETGYVIHVPGFIFLKNASPLGDKLSKLYNIHKKWIGSNISTIEEDNIFRVFTNQEGAICINCEEFIPYANADDQGMTLCWLCKTYPYR